MRPIDADRLMDALYDNEFQTLCPLDEVEGVIDAAPTLDVQPVRRGEWISNGIPESMLSACSVCGFPCGAYTFNFCPHCGADMRGDAHD